MAEFGEINTEDIEIDVLPGLSRETGGAAEAENGSGREAGAEAPLTEEEALLPGDADREGGDGIVPENGGSSDSVPAAPGSGESGFAVIGGEDGRKSRRGKNVGREILSWVLTIVIAVIAAVLINTYLIRASRVSGPSMQQTLQDGQTVWISRVPYIFSDAKRGDIIVFDSEQVHRNILVDISESFKYNAITYRFRKNSLEQERKYFIKRVIGVPGDTVRIELDGVYVNDVKLQEDYVNPDSPPNYSTWAGRTWVVGEGELFVMGDNRNNSRDSRAFDCITQNSVLGKVVKK